MESTLVYRLNVQVRLDERYRIGDITADRHEIFNIIIHIHDNIVLLYDKVFKQFFFNIVFFS